MNKLALGLVAFLFTLLACLPCGAGSAETAGIAPPLTLNEAGKQSLTGHIAVLHDASGTLDLTAIRRADTAERFQAPPFPGLDLGFTPGAWWVRTSLHNPGKAARMLWLEQRSPFQRSSILYRWHGDGRISRMNNGVQVAIAARDLPMRNIVFPVNLEPGETTTIWLRLSGSSKNNAELTLWQPTAYVYAISRSTALNYLALGISSVVVFFTLLTWETRRRPGILLGLPADILCVLYVFIQDGQVMDWIPATPELWPYHLRKTVVFLALACLISFANALLDLPRHSPAHARALRWLSLLTLTLALLFTLHIDHLDLFFHLARTIILGLLGITLHNALRGVPLGRLYLLAWGFLWSGIVLNSLHTFGLLPMPPLGQDAFVLGFIASSLTISLALYLDIRMVRANSEATHLHFRQHQLSEKQRLADAVAAQTLALQEAKALAEEASHAKTRFLSEVSHELRAPLHTMLGYAQLLARQANGDTVAKLDIISNSGAHLVRLIDDVLAYSRGEVNQIELDFEPMSLAALVTQLEQSAHLQAGKRGNQFMTTLAPGLPDCVLADEHRLTQVLQNLISNACKFTQDGNIHLSVSPEPIPARSSDEMARLRFTVKDTGIGIAAADHERIFAPFSRIRNAQRQPGMGLGLAIARQLVRAMGGDITLESVPRRGSRFSFCLDLQTSPVDAPRKQDPDIHLINGHAGRRRTLLIVDDRADNRRLLQHHCQQWGFATLLAEDGYEALALCRATTSPPIDAVLVDQFMPEADGWTFLRAVRETPSLARLPVILVSAAPATRPIDFPSDMDFDGMLLKPLRMAALAQLLERQLDLEWTWRAQDTEPAVDLNCDKLGPNEVAQLREALALGQVLNLQRQAAALTANPECAAFAQEVIRLCGLVDLPGLQRLFATALPEADEPAGA